MTQTERELRIKLAHAEDELRRMRAQYEGAQGKNARWAEVTTCNTPEEYEREQKRKKV